MDHLACKNSAWDYNKAFVLKSLKTTVLVIKFNANIRLVNRKTKSGFGMNKKKKRHSVRYKRLNYNFEQRSLTNTQ